jgi:hypothetical protein
MPMSTTVIAFTMCSIWPLQLSWAGLPLSFVCGERRLKEVFRRAADEVSETMNGDDIDAMADDVHSSSVRPPVEQ